MHRRNEDILLSGFFWSKRFCLGAFQAIIIQRDSISLLNHEDRERVEIVLKYIEDGDLRQWSLPDITAFNIGLREWRSKLNCITNPRMYQQLTEICSIDLITRGNTYLSHQQTDASKLLHKVFRVRLGRGFYGECLGVRADGNSDFSEIGKELSHECFSSVQRNMHECNHSIIWFVVAVKMLIGSVKIKARTLANRSPTMASVLGLSRRCRVLEKLKVSLLVRYKTTRKMYWVGHFELS